MQSLKTTLVLRFNFNILRRKKRTKKKGFWCVLSAIRENIGLYVKEIHLDIADWIRSDLYFDLVQKTPCKLYGEKRRRKIFVCLFAIFKAVTSRNASEIREDHINNKIKCRYVKNSVIYSSKLTLTIYSKNIEQAELRELTTSFNAFCYPYSITLFYPFWHCWTFSFSHFCGNRYDCSWKDFILRNEV